MAVVDSFHSIITNIMTETLEEDMLDMLLDPFTTSTPTTPEYRNYEDVQVQVLNTEVSRINGLRQRFLNFLLYHPFWDFLKFGYDRQKVIIDKIIKNIFFIDNRFRGYAGYN